MRKLTTLVGGLCLLLMCHAQSDNPFTLKVDSVTVPLDKSYITTGILYDRVRPFAALDLFNPQTDTSEYYLFTQAYFELFHARGVAIKNIRLFSIS